MVTTGKADGWGQCHTVGRVHPGRNFAAASGFENKRAVEAVNGLTSDDEDTVNGDFGPLEQPR
jgi:hypothetical protein